MRSAIPAGACVLILSAACSTTSVTPSAATQTPTAVATPGPTPTELVLDQLGFVRLEHAAGSESDYREGTVPMTLVVGTLGGAVTARINAGVSGEWDWAMSGSRQLRRWAATPAAGRVLWAGGTQLHAVDVSSGEDRIVHEAPSPIDHGAVSPDGSTAFVALREAGSANWSIWRVDLQGSAEPKLVRPALPEGVAATGTVLARTGSIFVRIAVAPDSNTLAVEECGGSLCRIWTMDLTTGFSRQYPGDAEVWPLQGVVGNVVLDHGPFNLETAERIDKWCVPALQTDGTAVVVCHGEYETSLQWGADVIDPRSGASRQAPLEEGREVMVARAADLGNGYPGIELPAGWVLAMERMPHVSEDVCDEDRYVAWNIDTGDLVPLPGLGPTCVP